MKYFLYHLLNKSFRKDLESLFGKNSEILIDMLEYSTNLKKYFVHCRLKFGEISETDEILSIYSESVNYLLQECWKWCSNDDELVVIVSLMED